MLNVINLVYQFMVWGGECEGEGKSGGIDKAVNAIS